MKRFTSSGFISGLLRVSLPKGLVSGFEEKLAPQLPVGRVNYLARTENAQVSCTVKVK